LTENSEETEGEDILDNQENETFKKKNSLIAVFKNQKVLMSIISGQLVIIILLLLNNTFENTSYNKDKNLDVSSSEYIFGIDVSHYQSRINWDELRTSHHPIEYVFVRATMGDDGIDSRFEENWKKAKEHNYIRGAYHYYRPNENSTKQFENFSKNVQLDKGDFIPILDVEKKSRFGRKNLREGVLNWLKLAEKKYGVKPLIYTGLTFYKHILKGHVDEYPLWIAAYSRKKHRLKGVDWTFHQFTEKVSVKGVKTSVDGNDFKGSMEDLNKMLIK
jgi:GH25 family lysozyme M1 (1,4-beta-N-acetylmuramidase)